MRVNNEPAAEGAEAKQAEISSADIVVGIPSYNNSNTIGHVVRAVDAGLGKYFPRERSVIINSDGGSTDSTPEQVIKASVDHKAIFLSHHISPVNRLTAP
ncbi:MAG: glycosyltransferase [Deltaproteobacteria bacterium]|nr:glycosyltransferase [Deltaproteobacteria bacterium]